MPELLPISLGSEGNTKEVALFDLNGKKTDSQSTSGSEAMFHVAGYTTGVYLVKVKNSSYLAYCFPGQGGRGGMLTLICSSGIKIIPHHITLESNALEE